MRLQRTVRISRVIAAREKMSGAVAVAVAACQVWTIVWLLALFRDCSVVVVVVIVERGRAEVPEEDDDEAIEGV